MAQHGQTAARIKQLLGSRKATPAVLEFLATTRAGRKPRVKEQKPEQRRRRRDEAWRLDQERLERSEDQEEGKRETDSEECQNKEEARGG